MKQIKYINEVDIKEKKVILRVDFNVSLNPDHSIADDARIRQALPTIKLLLENSNRLVLISHLGRPKNIDRKYSLDVVRKKLNEYFPNENIGLYQTIREINEKAFEKIVFLENIRFFSKEKDYSTLFAKELSTMGDIYVNDAFGVCHRSDTSVIGPPKFIPGYGGLLLKKELIMIDRAIKNPEKPIVAIIGGAKVSTKIGLINKLIKTVDYLIVGGGLANTFLCAQGYSIGQSFCEYETVQEARKILATAKNDRAHLVLPKDAVIANHKDDKSGKIVTTSDIPPESFIFDIGRDTKSEIKEIISRAKTIIWNGPVGYFENPAFRHGTDFIYYAITSNQNAVSIVGGGDTLAAISKKDYLDKITHVSTGGGAMLEYIEKGTLPGIEALKQSAT